MLCTGALVGRPADGSPPEDGTVTLSPFGVRVFALLADGGQQPGSRD